MLLTSTISEIKSHLPQLGSGKKTGFVPTMGALHKGHLSLVEQAVNENDIVIVSVFVNPTQFNDPKDLDRYPRNLEADLKLLEATGCDLVFAPRVNEIYPKPDTRKFNFGSLENVMEGKHRPGHFNGVAQVVSKLFDIVQPGKAYFGLKDLQQLAIIKNMVAQLQLPVEIVSCPIIREKSGLAMSSRNELLTAEERINASVISQTLFEAKKLKGEKTAPALAEWIAGTINKNPFLRVEYAEIVNEKTLKPADNWEADEEIVCCVAVYCGKIRLIDNVVF